MKRKTNQQRQTFKQGPRQGDKEGRNREQKTYKDKEKDDQKKKETGILEYYRDWK